MLHPTIADLIAGRSHIDGLVQNCLMFLGLWLPVEEIVGQQNRAGATFRLSTVCLAIQSQDKIVLNGLKINIIKFFQDVMTKRDAGFQFPCAIIHK